jgi:UDP-N-acetylglucosamine--N-acetylmuramyl-(pentapeptide) pyrophosphoryl-undecaprenol N-acetylglucosamine transferase
VIAGGGTGGHLFPALATAEEIKHRRSDAEILFITGKRRMDSRILDSTGYAQAFIKVEALKGLGLRKTLHSLLSLPRSFSQAMRILKAFDPSLVFGVGGYSSGPVCAAAKVLGIPTAIHEQNSFPGLTNRLLCRFVDLVFISFDESGKKFPGGKKVLTGNPVRKELFHATAPDSDGKGGLRVLTVGGSQGAMAVNTAVAGALYLLKEQGKAISIVHQTGDNDYKRVLKLYTDLGIAGVVKPFIDDMAEAYANADLVIGRAGASTVSELAALGKPSILIPFPFASDDHQSTNARSLSDAGGAVFLAQSGLSGGALARIILKFHDDRDALRQMGQQAKKQGKPYASKAIVDGLEELIGPIHS